MFSCSDGLPDSSLALLWRLFSPVAAAVLLCLCMGSFPLRHLVFQWAERLCIHCFDLGQIRFANVWNVRGGCFGCFPCLQSRLS
eukprot:2930461-Prorocentrum_lima.AAC.1